MKLFELIFNTESVPWWRTCLDFKHWEEAFGYFRAYTPISLPIYTFGKQFNWRRTGEIGFDHNPSCHSAYCLPVQSGSLQFYCLPIPKFNFKTSEVKSCHCIWRFSLWNDSILNVPCLSFICSCHYPHFLPLPPSNTCNHPKWLPHSLCKYFSTW